jgi:hypothetical protein
MVLLDVSLNTSPRYPKMMLPACTFGTYLYPFFNLMATTVHLSILLLCMFPSYSYCLQKHLWQWMLRKRSHLFSSPEKEHCYSCGREVKAGQMSRHFSHSPQCSVDIEGSQKRPANNHTRRRKRRKRLEEIQQSPQISTPMALTLGVLHQCNQMVCCTLNSTDGIQRWTGLKKYFAVTTIW